MKRRSALAWLATLGITQILIIQARADILPWSDAGVSRPKYEHILKWESGLEKKFSSLVRIVEYGKTPKGLPLRLILVKKPNMPGPHPTLIMSGSTHGNEYLHIEDRLPEEILKKAQDPGVFARFLDEGGAFVFVPILNPDGFVAGTRENSHYEDLNRDWTVRPAEYVGFREPETKQLADALERLKDEASLSYKVSVDYHCCAGALLYPWSFKNPPALPAEVLEQFKTLGALAMSHLGVDIGRTGDLLGYAPTGTTKDYYYDHYGTLSLTYEGKYRVEPSQLEKHVAWWSDMVSFLQGESKPSMIAKQRTAPKVLERRSAD